MREVSSLIFHLLEFTLTPQPTFMILKSVSLTVRLCLQYQANPSFVAQFVQKS